MSTPDPACPNTGLHGLQSCPRRGRGVPDAESSGSVVRPECWFLGPVSELPVGGIRKPAYSGAGCEYSEPGENLGTVACNPVNTSESNEGGQ
jgi:hypothetical protein